MWLLDTDDGSFFWIDRPREHRYAILSHVWRQGGEETFQDLRALQNAEKARKGLKRRLLKIRTPLPSVLSRASDKIRGCCAVARKHGYRWAWIDSCCIDKTSSSELSEAINSMHEWYAAADVCFALLDDVGDDHDPRLKDSKFRRSRWFTRGWTLQELIAPAVVVFFSKDWRLLGTKEQLADLVEQITGVDRAVLRHEIPLDAVSVARRMSWASKRQTTREEDRAYSLMGIFGVNMPTIYGEGQNAFIRLQEEILKHVPDQTIFAWGPTLFDDAVLYKGLGPRSVVDDSRYWQSRNLLAWSPDAFITSGGISSISLEAFENRVGLAFSFSEYHVTSYGMRLRVPLIPIQHGSNKTTYLAILACEDAAGNLLALMLFPQREGSSRYYVGHYVGSPQVPPYAYFRAVSLSKARLSEILHTAGIQDVCIPYRASLMGHRKPQPIASPALFKCPCDVVVPGWVASKLREEGFAAAALRENNDDDLTLHISEVTSFADSILVLKSAKETIRIHMGRCPCIGQFLAVSVVGSGDAGLERAATVRSGGMVSGFDNGLLSSRQDKRSIASLGAVDRPFGAAKIADLAPRCPTGHVAAWEGGSKEFAYGNRTVRLTFSAWLTRQDVYTLGVELGTEEVPEVE
ncbi:HET-domain-containing protein [Dichomitus squalens LYAD-421 SS1]|uniref:HET-domain-containing protein n=1 Tax=Dichomitus squalens TaxID=114155 RepID=A0A4Q9MIL0_9APHY|nr:HET-domain-containing protein [Dichomitus squalens LYAD-421 SS1]EJF64136.1 HET-domain-containing protein [Dichomitus squalens LYAD-421 SS1]TBU27259.1 HET-domain-containing protein [Dichomitus squalens]